jgi:hypothetical protein
MPDDKVDAENFHRVMILLAVVWAAATLTSALIAVARLVDYFVS